MDENKQEYKGLYFHPETPQRVRDVLAAEFHTGRRLRLHYGDTATGRVWLEEYDIIGTVSRSTGRIKIPILIFNSRSFGGMGILDNCIVRIQDVKTKADLYAHPKYAPPELRIVAAPYPDKPEYLSGVTRDSELQAAFKSWDAANAYRQFMRGERMTLRP